MTPLNFSGCWNLDYLLELSKIEICGCACTCKKLIESQLVS